MKIASKVIISFFLTGLALAAIIALGVVAKLNIVLLLIIAPVIAGLIGFFISKAISEPVQELYRKAKIVHPGTMAQEVGAESTDEVGRLSMEFDSIAEDLKKSNIALQETGKENAEQKKTIQELRDREEHFRRLFEQSNDAVFIYDFEGRILDVNNRACDMLGYSKGELLKIPFLELQTEEELTKSKRAYKTGADTCSLRLESKFKKNNGKVIDVEISSSCVDLKKGIMQGIVSNITERKELEAALKESEEKFRTFMETASDLMYITDKSDNLIYVNEAMVNTLGYSREEMIGLHITDILNRESLKDYNEHKRQLAGKGEVIYEPVWETKSRIEIEGEIRVVAIYDGEGRFVGSRGIFRDISERKKVERSQRLAQLGKLAADVAHEVNNPVSIICGNAELAMMDYPGDEKLKKTFETIVGQCEHANDIVKRLLMFSKPSKHDFMEKGVNEAIQVIVNLISTHFLHGGVEVALNLAPKLPPVLMDEKQIQEVFMNLLRNAFEAMPDGGDITVTTSREGNSVRTDIKDTGSGIPEEVMKKIFDPFFTTKEKGTGLGLSVCYGILKAHGGDLKYSSEPGEGTIATVLLPIAGK